MENSTTTMEPSTGAVRPYHGAFPRSVRTIFPVPAISVRTTPPPDLDQIQGGPWRARRCTGLAATGSPAPGPRVEEAATPQGPGGSGAAGPHYVPHLERGSWKYTPELIPVARNAMAMGAKVKDLARLFGVAWQYIYQWMQKHEDFKEAIQAGRDQYVVDHLEPALFKRALGFEAVEEKTVLGPGGDTLERTRTVKMVAPDVGALKLALTNLAPDRWRDLKQIDSRGSVAHSHAHKGKVQFEHSPEEAADVFDVLLGCIGAGSLAQAVGGLSGSSGGSNTTTH